MADPKQQTRTNLEPQTFLGAASVAFFFLIHFTIVFLNTFFVLGLQRLASQLQSPYVPPLYLKSLSKPKTSI